MGFFRDGSMDGTGSGGKSEHDSAAGESGVEWDRAVGKKRGNV